METSTSKNNMSKSDMSSSAVVRNISASFANFSLRFFIGIWFTRYLINNIGTEAYGLIPLAWSLTNYFELITLILNAPAGRYLIIEMSRGDHKAANRIFNTVLWGLCGLFLIVLPVSIIVSWLSPLIFKIPPGHESDARLIFLTVSGAFAITTLSNPLSLSTYVTNRLDIRNISEALQLLVRVGIACSFIFYFGWGLGAISLGICISSIIGLFITVAFWRLLTPALKIERPNINIPILKEITGFGGWVLIDQIGTILLLSSELIIVNLLYGANATGKYGAILLIPATIRSVAGVISNALVPPIMDRYAKGDTKGAISLVTRAMRMLGLFVALPLGLVCGFSAPLLRIWLGPEFANLSLVLIVLTAPLCINLAALPIFPIEVITKRVKVPGICTLIFGLINILLAIILGWPGWGIGLIGIPLAGAIVFTLKNVVFSLIYGAHILNKNKMFFYPALLTGIKGFVIVVISIFFIMKVIEIDTILQLLTAFTFIALGYSVVLWFIILSKEDKTWLLSQTPLFKR